MSACERWEGGGKVQFQGGIGNGSTLACHQSLCQKLPLKKKKTKLAVL
jgi:hypothetical protein